MQELVHLLEFLAENFDAHGIEKLLLKTQVSEPVLA